MKRTAKLLLAAGIAASILVPATAASAAVPKFTPLTLENGWTGGPFHTAQPQVALVAGVVTFKGALAGGTTNDVFTLPAADTPSTDVYLHTGLCADANGRLLISSTGQVSVLWDSLYGASFADAQCFVSLDGLSFTLSEKGAKPLTLASGWTNAPFATSNAAVRTIAGVVRLQGAVAGGTDAVIATLPKAYWPKDPVFAPADLCGAAHGYIFVGTNGVVSVTADHSFGDAQCFTSLDGVNWLKADSKGNAKALTLENGWQSFSTVRPAGLHASAKVVRFAGAVSGGTDEVIGTIPLADAPATDVYIPATACSASPAVQSENARLHITPAGVVDVETNGNASCETIFDGAWFAQ